MQAIDRHFAQIINGTTQFIIPVFQRDYTWTEEQCRQLWHDVLRAAGQVRGHFMGSIVYVDTGSAASFTRWLVIDGQQRMTTLTLLLTALRDHINETGWSGTEDSPTPDRINSYFLVNPLEPGNRHRKLVLRRADDSTLASLVAVDVKLPDAPSEPIVEAYRLFKELVASHNDPDEVYRGVARLVVVDVKLDDTDNPQLVFESLNSTGVDLSQADLIRNYVLMGLPEEEQTRLYNKHWSEIEKCFRGSGSRLDSFARDYVAHETRITKQTRGDQIYRAFKDHYNCQTAEDWEAMLLNMTRSAKYYAAFTLGRNVEAEVGEALRNIRNLGDVAAILVTKLFGSFDGVDEEGFLDSLSIVESYLFRRAICGFQTRNYWSVFARIALEIRPNNPLESLQVALSRQHGSYRFPSDDEFRRALLESNLYGLQACRHLLDRLENHGTEEKSDTSNYSIEHILPQNENLRQEWRQMLGENWRQEQEEWLHRLGNLTLTGYNSSYSDRPFHDKKNIPGGFNESAVRLNKFVREQSVWTAKQIETRGFHLAERALQIWPSLQVEQRAIEEAISLELRALAEGRCIEQVEMNPEAKTLFNLLRAKVLELGDLLESSALIELPERKSVSYHSPYFFLEVLPRTGYLTLLLAPDYSDIDDNSGFVKDASEWKYLAHSRHDGGGITHVSSEEDVIKVVPFVRQAFTLARE